ncbi:MAG: hypothetical protein DRO65_02100 [Candidatus Altiarchaeales archaeon]|nr:MAG: hypothetical protein DRO65_02100 [Candidatus Altiarchaeales archaeon]
MGKMIPISEMLVPALIGGVVSGVLSSVPFIDCLCCLWFIGGGALAAYMLVRNVGKITLEDGAAVGGLSGIIGGIISSILGFILSMVLNVGMPMMFEEIPKSKIALGTLGIVVLLISCAITTIIGAILGAIGGVIFVKLKE